MRSAIGRGIVCGLASELPLVTDLLIERDQSPTRGSPRSPVRSPPANPPGSGWVRLSGGDPGSRLRAVAAGRASPVREGRGWG
jgi:hypothetical protein